MPKKKRISSSLVPQNQGERERKRVLKPQEERTKQPKARIPKDPNLEKFTRKIRPKLSPEERHERRVQAGKKAWANKTKEQRDEQIRKMQEGKRRKREQRERQYEPLVISVISIDALAYQIKQFSMLKDYAEGGTIIKWDGNYMYGNIEKELNSALAVLDALNPTSLEKLKMFLDNMASSYVYEYDGWSGLHSHMPPEVLNGTVDRILESMKQINQYVNQLASYQDVNERSSADAKRQAVEDMREFEEMENTDVWVL